VGVEMALNEVGEHLGVGVASEAVALLREAGLQALVVLDDPVVDNGHAAAAVEVRVGVDLGRRAMGRPAGVRDAYGPARRGPVQLRLERGDAAHRLDTPQLALLEHGNPC